MKNFDKIIEKLKTIQTILAILANLENSKSIF
jgi:hypothetical protein